MLADILYYPSIEFQSEDWIKRSLLYWDRVYRIVPDGYTPNDSDLVRSLISDGFIKNIRVSEGQLRQAATEFLKRFRNSWLIQNLREGKLLPDTSKIKNKRGNSYQSYLVGIDKSAVRALPGEANQNLEELIND